MAAACAAASLLAVAGHLPTAARLCCQGRHVVVGYPPISWAPVLHSKNGSAPTGFVPAVWDEIAKELGISYEYKAFEFPPSSQHMTGAVVNGTADAIFYPLNEEFVHSPGLALTHPMFTSWSEGWVLRTRVEPGLFRFLDPFKTDLWVAVACAVLVTALAIVSLRSVERPKAGAGLVLRCTDTAFSVWSAMLGSDDFQWSKLSQPGRILRIGMLLFVLITISTYTANLAAFFTRPLWRLHGPSSMEGLKGAKVCVAALQQLGQTEALAGVVGSVAARASNDILSENLERDFEYCLQQLRSGAADIWVDPPAFIEKVYLRHCHEVGRAPWLRVAPTSFSVAMRTQDRAFLNYVNAALLDLQLTPQFLSLQEEHFGWGRACTKRKPDDTAKVSVEQTAGVIIVFAVAALCAVAIAGGQRAVRSAESEPPGHEGVPLPSSPPVAPLADPVSPALVELPLVGQSSAPPALVELPRVGQSAPPVLVEVPRVGESCMEEATASAASSHADPSCTSAPFGEEVET
eukprot:TRINITY_DN18973_c0_g2_i1.p1 TRINITY_DN18973_c0_g2~~TRINITY_DN18973_c0_g2_i1.p1  ORF type:complete len:533 (+),score=186.68 TRINITY_DN18973_c0_g2_i1:46-1599(+)